MKKNKTRRPKILSIEFIRIFIIALVIAVHISASDAFYGSSSSGAIWMLAHVSRSLFLIIMAFVLFYQYQDLKAKDTRSFYKRRFPLVAVPYAVWTLIYQVQDGIHQASLWDFISKYLYNLVTANAWYHLYFILLTIQLYLLFPLIIWAWHWIRPMLKPMYLLLISFIIQLAITGAMHFKIDITSLNWWLSSPDKNILSYQLYVVIGILSATYWEPLSDWLFVNRKKIYVAAAGVSAIGLADYFMQLAYGLSPVWVSEVFQPLNVVEVVVFMSLFTALGIAWERKGASHRILIETIGQSSFGIFLVHALIIKKLSFLQPHSDEWYTVIITVLIGVPLVYAIAFVFSEILRRTPFSLMFTGRKQVAWSTPWFIKQRRSNAKVENSIV